MKKLLLISAGMAFILVSTLIVHAQSTTPDSIVQVAAESQGLSLVSPSDLPDCGTFWLMTSNGVTVPDPAPLFDPSLPVYQIADGQYLVDATEGQVVLDTGQTVADALAGLSNAVVDLVSQVQDAQASQETAMSSRMTSSRMAGGMMAMDDEEGGDDFTPAFSFDTNSLWLQINAVSNGLAYVNLNNATDSIYAIWSATNLLGGWNVESEVWPTNSTVMPFTVNTANRGNLFLRAQDWTGVTHGGNTTPDWWFYYWFGTVDLSDSDLDSVGNTLLDDYENGADPNVIQFTIEATNDYVNYTNVSVQLNITAGTPGYYAVLVNDTNEADAVWQAYMGTNITASLGSTDGVYDVNVGFRGFATNATQTWNDYSFTLDTVPPVLVITNPTTGTVIKPYLQLQGFANEQLASLSYDISNALMVATNQDAFVTDQYFDTNRFDFTTNYFQAYDVPLTTNANHITLRVADRAGNMTVTNFNVTLDYTAATNSPMVSLIWPQDGWAVSGSNITMRGTMSDETGTVQAQVVNGDGTTNVIAGIVERDNMFWLENVPLNGTNRITLQATDAAGNVTTTNFTIMPSSLTLTIDSTPTGDALYQYVGSVSGHVSDPTASVTVNGVQGTNNGDGTWSADGVPIYGQGTATFDVQTMTGGYPTNNASAAVEMGPYVLMTRHHCVEVQDAGDASYRQVTKDLAAQAVITPDHHWGMTGGATNDTEWAYLFIGFGEDVYTWSLAAPGQVWGQYSDGWGDDYGGPLTYSDPAITSMPHEDQTWGESDGEKGWVRHYYAAGVAYQWPLGDGNIFKLSVTAKTQVKLYTGGKAKVARQNLFQINAWANEILKPPFDNGTEYPWWDVQQKTIDKASLTVANKAVGADGNVWLVLPDNSPGIDITVKAPRNHYDAGDTPTKYHPYITDNGDNLDTDTPTNCVGQLVTFQLNWSPSTPPISNMVGNWNLPGKFVNYSFQDSPPYGSINYYTHSDLLQNTNQTSCWFYNKPGGKVVVGMDLLMNNGQHVGIAADGSISVYRPTFSDFTQLVYDLTWSFPYLGADMSWRVTVNSKYDGQYGITQLLLGTGIYYGTDGEYVLDGNSEIYGDTYGTNGPSTYNVDDPSSQTVHFQDDPSAPTTSMDLAFKDYLRFQPSGSGNIYVTIATNGWSVNASVNPITGTLTPTNIPPATYPVDNDEFPRWDTYRPGH